MRRCLTAVVVVLVLPASLLAAMSLTSQASAVPTSGTYHVLAPKRILDTGTKAVAARGEVVLPVAGAGNVPQTGASAVVLNVTVVSPKAGGFITVYPDDLAKPPTVSNLNFVAGQTVPNLVVVQLPGDGKVRLYNGSSGTVRLLADVSGYYTGSNAPSGQGGFGAVAPTRILDTRHAIGAPQKPVAKGASVAVPATGNSGTGVPSGATAVVLNVTVTAPVTAGFITAYADGARRPATSNLNFSARQTVPNLVVAPVGSDGKVALYNGSGGTVDLLADVSGYFLAGDPLGAGAFGGLAPARLLSTRDGIGARRAAVPRFATLTLSVGGRAGVPLADTAAVVLNVTALAPTNSGFLTVFAGGSTRPDVSNVNFVKGDIVPNLVLAPVSTSGTVSIYNGSGGTVQVLADVSGYVLHTTAPLPTVQSTSRYVRNINGTASDAGTMGAEGCADARNGSSFVLLDIGAQLNDTTGVQLSTTTTNLTYAQLVTALDAYLDGYAGAGCRSGTAAATIAVATNNDGNFSAYHGADRGAAWAARVIEPLRAHVAAQAYPNLDVVGADDIEPDGSSTEAQAEDWENGYLDESIALNDSQSRLVFVGSADGCPSTYGAAPAGCNHSWTQAQLYRLSHSISTRIVALPQIYVPAQAVQWADIDAVGGGAIVFAGALTESAACGTPGSPGCTFTAVPADAGWAALYHALSTVRAAPSLPVLTDLQVDG